jgi:hypothetical protein
MVLLRSILPAKYRYDVQALISFSPIHIRSETSNHCVRRADCFLEVQVVLMLIDTCIGEVLTMSSNRIV